MQCLSEKNENTLRSLFEYLSGRIASGGAHKRTLVAGKEELNFKDLQEGSNFNKVLSSWQSYNQQEEVLNQKSLPLQQPCR